MARISNLPDGSGNLAFGDLFPFVDASDGLNKRTTAEALVQAGQAGPTVFAHRMTGSDFGAKVMSAHDLLPSTGGLIDARGLLGPQSNATAITLAKDGTTLYLPMGVITSSVSLAIGDGVQSVQIIAPSLWGAQWNYTGSGDAVLIGGTGTDGLGHQILGLSVSLLSAGSAARALVLKRVQHWVLQQIALQGKTSANTQEMLVCDGTGNYCGTGVLLNSRVTGGALGIHFTGTGAQQGNNIQILNGGVFNQTSIGLKIDAGANGNQILGTDFENIPTAVQDLNGLNHIQARFENNSTYDMDWGAAAVRGIFDCIVGSGANGEPKVRDQSAGVGRNVVRDAMRVCGAWSNDRGNQSITITPGIDFPRQRFDTVLTAARTVTLSTTYAVAGDAFRIVRGTTATGDFDLTIGTTVLPRPGMWCDFIYDGAAWVPAGGGSSLPANGFATFLDLSRAANRMVIGVVDGTVGSIAGANTGELIYNADIHRFFDKGSSAEAARIDSSGIIQVTTVGGGFKVKEGTNATMGLATLVAGAVVVSTTKVTASSRILLAGQADGGTPGFLRVSARTAGTSFTITSSNGADTSTVAWLIMEPA